MVRIRLIVGILYVIYLMVLMAIVGGQHEPLVPGVPIPDKEDNEEHILSFCGPDTVYFQDHSLPILISNYAGSGHDASSAVHSVVLHLLGAITYEPGFVARSFCNVILMGTRGSVEIII